VRSEAPLVLQAGQSMAVYIRVHLYVFLLRAPPCSLLFACQRSMQDPAPPEEHPCSRTPMFFPGSSWVPPWWGFPRGAPQGALAHSCAPFASASPASSRGYHPLHRHGCLPPSSAALLSRRHHHSRSSSPAACVRGRGVSEVLAAQRGNRQCSLALHCSSTHSPLP